jgi:nucleotide-binding universal stress UspA family protein
LPQDERVFLNILVAVDGSEPSARALEHAIDVARSMNSRLTLITVAPPLSAYVTLAGVSTETMLEDAGPEILAEIERGGYDLVVLGSRGRGRTQEGLLGSVNGYVHFHSRVALLSVP